MVEYMYLYDIHGKLLGYVDIPVSDTILEWIAY